MPPQMLVTKIPIPPALPEPGGQYVTQVTVTNRGTKAITITDFADSFFGDPTDLIVTLTGGGAAVRTAGAGGLGSTGGPRTVPEAGGKRTPGTSTGGTVSPSSAPSTRAASGTLARTETSTVQLLLGPAMGVILVGLTL